MLRPQLHYRRDCFETGLKRAGYLLSADINSPRIGDVLIIWNRYGHYHDVARRFERARADVLIAENGWIGEQQFALCRSHHNGAGGWYVGKADRWQRLGVELKDWRRGGDHILVLPQRGIGEPGVAMPANWLTRTVAALSKATRRPIRVRAHPGVERPPLEPDLENCHAVVTWASGAAVKAIAAGVPAFHSFERWIAAGAARRGLADIENPFLGDRLPMFRRLAWAQWSLDEIASGEPFKCLLM